MGGYFDTTEGGKKWWLYFLLSVIVGTTYIWSGAIALTVQNNLVFTLPEIELLADYNNMPAIYSGVNFRYVLYVFLISAMCPIIKTRNDSSVSKAIKILGIAFWGVIAIAEWGSCTPSELAGGVPTMIFYGLQFLVYAAVFMHAFFSIVNSDDMDIPATYIETARDGIVTVGAFWAFSLYLSNIISRMLM